MLKEVLGLPDDKSEIWELSGGQQKMVSLSLTFLHSPRLLILDEVRLDFTVIILWFIQSNP